MIERILFAALLFLLGIFLASAFEKRKSWIENIAWKITELEPNKKYFLETEHELRPKQYKKLQELTKKICKAKGINIIIINNMSIKEVREEQYKGPKVGNVHIHEKIKCSCGFKYCPYCSNGCPKCHKGCIKSETTSTGGKWTNIKNAVQPSVSWPRK